MVKRRTLLISAGVAGVGAVAFGGSLWRGALTGSGPTGSAPAEPGSTSTGRAGPGAYGELGALDANGLRLPEGFTSRVVARTGEVVPGTDYTWHGAPDGGACFPAADGGWIYVSNSEVADKAGGAGALRFDARGEVVDAYRILGGTDRNCAGGATPWGTWLSCEEFEGGRVFETDPHGVREPVERLAMGRFIHEAAAVDPRRQVVYLTEDDPSGCFYRFVPTRWPDLAHGRLEVLVGTADEGPVTWTEVPDPSGAVTPTQNQVPGAKRFYRGEGCYYAHDVCYFTTTGDNKVWAYRADRSELAVFHAGGAGLSGVDNVTVSASDDVFVAEDGDNMEICLIEPNGRVSPFLRIEGHQESEICGPAFSPDGRRLYFSSQRGVTGEPTGTGGVTYEVTGPFRGATRAPNEG